MKLREVLATNLKHFRLAAGLSQEELAHRAHLDRTYVSSLERGRYSASIDKIESLIAPSVSSRRAMVERKRFSAWTLVATGRNSGGCAWLVRLVRPRPCIAVSAFQPASSR